MNTYLVTDFIGAVAPDVFQCARRDLSALTKTAIRRMFDALGIVPRYEYEALLREAAEISATADYWFKEANKHLAACIVIQKRLSKYEPADPPKVKRSRPRKSKADA